MLDLKNKRYNDVLDHKLPLKFEFLRLSRQLLCHMIRDKLLHSYVRDGEHPILNKCVWHNGNSVCSAGKRKLSVCLFGFFVSLFLCVLNASNTPGL